MFKLIILREQLKNFIFGHRVANLYRNAQALFARSSENLLLEGRSKKDGEGAA
jgi:hypothetical protein